MSDLKDNECIITARLSYANIWEVKESKQGTEQTTVALLIPKKAKEDIAKIKKALNVAKEMYAEKFGNGVIPKGLKLPVRDGDAEKDDEIYQGMYFINAANKNKVPAIFDIASGNKRLNPDGEKPSAAVCARVYSGCIARVHLQFYPFKGDESRGVAVAFPAIKKVKDGKRLDGSPVINKFKEEDFEEEIDLGLYGIDESDIEEGEEDGFNEEDNDFGDF